MPPLSVLIKPASSLCNLSCDYCFYCDEAEKRNLASYGLMSEQTLKNVIRKTMLQAEGSITYAFQGGEPTLCGLSFFEKAVAYQKQYQKEGLVVHNALQTNGYLIDEEWCRFFADNHFLIGLSMDGTPDIHNRHRHERGSGKDTFARVSHSADLMEQFLVDFNILTVVTADIADHIYEVYEYYRQRGWKYQQYIACLDPLDEPHGQSEYALAPEKYGSFLIELFGLWYEDLKKGQQPYIRQFENYVGIAAGYLPESCDQRGHCSIQNVIEADGGVYPCDFYVLDEYLLGNFNTDRLHEIDAKRKETGFLERSLKLSADCKICRYFSICKGGCQRHRDFVPETGLYSNYFCSSYVDFFDHWYDTIQLIARNLR